MAINLRTNKRVACKICGQGDLEWVNVGAARGWTEPRLVPFGTSDLSGKVHALTPDECARKNRAPTNGAGVAVAPNLAAVEAEIKLLHAKDAELVSEIETVTRAVEKFDTGLADKVRELGDTLGDVQGKVVDALAEMKRRLVQAESARPIEIKMPNGLTHSVGRQHYMFANALAMMLAIGDTGVLYLVGEAGSGKSTVAKFLAEMLAAALGVPTLGDDGLNYEADTWHPMITGIDLLGFKDANGKTVETKYYRRYRYGGLMFCDEISRGTAEAVAAVNGMTSSSETGFVDGIIQRHERCYFAAGANTFGRGADNDYIGNSQLDAASLSRFVYLPFNTDWEFIAEMYGMSVSNVEMPEFPAPDKPRSHDESKDWAQRVYDVKRVVQGIGIHAVISSRAVINGYKMLRAGIDRDLVEYSTMWAHMSPQDADKVKANL